MHLYVIGLHTIESMTCVATREAAFKSDGAASLAVGREFYE